MKPIVHDIIICKLQTSFHFSCKVTDDENGFMWAVYDSDGAHLYCENYNPDEINPVDEADMFCDGYVSANYS